VLDVDDSSSAPAPGREKISDPLFGLGIVPRTQARIVKAPLHVDDE